MKKIFSLFILLTLVFSVSSLFKKVKRADTDNVANSIVNDVKNIQSAQKELANVAAIVPSVDAFKEEFESKNDFKEEKQVSALIEEKDQKLNSLNLISKANAGILSHEESTQLVTLMRTKIALNQILLDMKMKKFERRFL